MGTNHLVDCGKVVQGERTAILKAALWMIVGQGLFIMALNDIEWLQGLLIKFKGELNETFPELLLNVTFSKLRNTPLHHNFFFQRREFKEMCLGHCMPPIQQIEIKHDYNIL